MTKYIDQKATDCLQFITEIIGANGSPRAEPSTATPLFIGMNGAQGAGKTTLVSTVAQGLTVRGLPTIVLSIDDFYLSHNDQIQLASKFPSNPLIQHRGQPSTHDLPLLLSVLSALRKGEECRLPIYDKSAFSGQGERAGREHWPTVNTRNHTIGVVILEGWCVGFRALNDGELRRLWDFAVSQKDNGDYTGRLGWNSLENIQYVNDALRKYDEVTNQFDALIHLDAENPLFVYSWRLEQESSLRDAKGRGMTDEQVVEFVNGYYPSYELFTEGLRAGIFPGGQDRQLRLVLGRNRETKKVVRF